MVCRRSIGARRLLAALTLVVCSAGCATDALRGRVELPSEGTAGPTQLLPGGQLNLALARLAQLPHVFQIPDSADDRSIASGSAGWKRSFDDDALGKSGNITGALFIIRAAIVVAELLAKLPAQNESCTDHDRWHEQLDYGQKLARDNEADAARAVLIPALAACDPKVRQDALASLNQLPSKPQCSNKPGWPKELKEALQHRDRSEITGTMPDRLNDCDPTIRAEAFAFLLQLPPESPLTPDSPDKHHEEDLAAKFGKVAVEVGKALGATAVVTTTAKSVAPIIFVYFLVFAIIALIIFFNRTNLEIESLNVVGSDFPAQQFASIATHISAEMDEMERVAKLGQHAGRANLGTATVATVAGQATAVAKAFAGDAAQTVLGAALAFFNRPKYQCSGSMYFVAEHTHVLLHVSRRSVRWSRIIPWLIQRDIWHWEGIVPKENLLGVLKQRAYELLLETGGFQKPRAFRGFVIR